MGWLTDLVARWRGYRDAGVQRVTLERPIWSLESDCGYLSVVGESHYQPALRRLNAELPGQDRRVQCVLRAEPDNPYDRHAVAVLARGYKVGHLSRHVAPEYQPIVLSVNQTGHELGFVGNLTGGGNQKFYGITAHLPDPLKLRQWVAAGPGVRFLMGDRSVTVTGEEAYQDTLEPAFRTARGQFLNFELRPGTTPKGHYSLGVFLDGSPVGKLTTKMSQRYRHHVDGSTVPVVAAGLLSLHETRGVQVELHAPRPG